MLSSDDAIGIKEFWKKYSIKDAIFNVASAWTDLSVSNLKNGWNKLWPEIIPCESEETEPNSVEEIVQLCNNGLHSEILSTKISNMYFCKQQNLASSICMIIL